jgi:pyruvate dehydrogenase E2 component (dihydrolipoamide acetyltransferase)
MPALSPTMEKGKLARWHVKEGDNIKSGDVIAEIETDKATMEVEAIEEGRIARLYVEEGTDDVAVNTTIALIETDEGKSGVSQQPVPPGKEPKGEYTAVPTTPAKPGKTQKDREAPMLQTSSTAAAAMAAGAERIFASPLARRLAKERNIALSAIKGSGPGGRIVKNDVLAAPASTAAPATTVAAAVAAQAGAPVASPPSAMAAPALPAGLGDKEILSLYAPGSYEVVPHDNMRKVIASRLTLAKTSIPHFYLTIDCELDRLLQARSVLNDGVVAEGIKLSVNDFIIKALALALKKVPNANATWTSEAILRHTSADIAVAVAVEGGLFTPVLRNADAKSLSQISTEMKDLATRARSKRLAPHEYQGGTTSISNLGMYDIRQFEAVINPPHASILAVGRGEQRAVVRNGALAVANVMTCTLSCDHRVIDGALGAELLKAFKTFIENPVAMLA